MYNIPAYLSDFSTLEDGRTKLRLKVLYVGETEDGRIFDEKFSAQLKDSLADAPVVAYYSDLQKDFLGHNSVQYVFGHVPSTDSNTEFKQEDGKTWLFTDVLLYTDRVDSIGEVAKKIVGHPHSLELDPKTVSYEMKREGGKTKIHFLKGRICGLSVLGTEQKPAFTGSAFLNCSVNPELQSLRERFENFFNCLEEESRGGQMNEDLTVFESLANHARLSYDEKQHAVANKFAAEMGEDYGFYIAEMYDDEVIFATINWNSGEQAFKKCKYSFGEDGMVNLSDLEDVFHVFVTASQKALLENQTTASSNEGSCSTPVEEQQDDQLEPSADPEDASCGDPDKKKKECELTPEDGAATNAEVNDNANNSTDFAALYESAKVELEELKGAKADLESAAQKLSATNAELEIKFADVQSQLEAATVELEKFKLSQKQSLIESYKNDLEEETIADFSARINDVEYSVLESELALSYTKSHKGKITSEPLPQEIQFQTLAESNEPSSYADLVKKWKNKNK